MKRLPLFWKIFGSIGVTVILVVAFQIVYFPNQQIARLELELQRKAESLALVVTPQLAAALDFDDTTAREDYLKALAQDADVAFAVLFDGEGQVLNAHGIDAATALKLEVTWQDNPSTSSYRDRLIVKRPVKTPGGARSVLVLGVSTASIVEESRIIRLTALGVGGVIILLAVIVALLVARPIGQRVRELAQIAEKVADGDLAHPPVRFHSEDEIGRMAASFNRMLASQRALVRQISETALQLSAASNDLIATAQEQEQGAREQSTTVEEVSSSMTALSETARAIAENADRMASIAEQVSDNATEGQAALRVAGDAIQEIVKQNETIASRINSLYEKSQAIISVVDIIDDISDRLDLLALNAALEGSRVGEAGKGFSLVAQEMRRLAENVSGSTKQIKETIDEIHRHIKGSLEASQDGTATTREGATEIGKMSDAIAKIFSLISSSTEVARSITISTQQQLTSTEQMVAAMSEVASVSNEGLSSALGVTEAASGMTNLAARLREQVRPFRTGDENTPPTATG